MRALEIEPAVVETILDWVDTDSETRFPNGAEDDYYMRLKPPYRAANRPFSDRRELLLVRGVSKEIFAAIAPHVVILPEFTALNVNTAEPESLMSLAAGNESVHGQADHRRPQRTSFPAVSSSLFSSWRERTSCREQRIVGGFKVFRTVHHFSRRTVRIQRALAVATGSRESHRHAP